LGILYILFAGLALLYASTLVTITPNFAHPFGNMALRFLARSPHASRKDHLTGPARIRTPFPGRTPRVSFLPLFVSTAKRWRRPEAVSWEGGCKAVIPLVPGFHIPASPIPK
jgi:hypothetical protein